MTTRDLHIPGTACVELAVSIFFVFFLFLGAIETARVIHSHLLVSSLSREIANMALRFCVLPLDLAGFYNTSQEGSEDYERYNRCPGQDCEFAFNEASARSPLEACAMDTLERMSQMGAREQLEFDFELHVFQCLRVGAGCLTIDEGGTCTRSDPNSCEDCRCQAYPGEPLISLPGRDDIVWPLPEITAQQIYSVLDRRGWAVAVAVATEVPRRVLFANLESKARELSVY